MREADWEALAMDTLGELAWEPVEGKTIAPGSGERESWSELIIPGRLREAIARINPELPDVSRRGRSASSSCPRRPATPGPRTSGCTSS